MCDFFVCMCACVHVCMYSCMHVCMFYDNKARFRLDKVRVCVCVIILCSALLYVCMCACVHVCMCACVHVCMYACMLCVCVCV